MKTNDKHECGTATHFQPERTNADHPVRELLRHLQRMEPVASHHHVSPLPSDLREQLTASAESVMAVCQNGMAALGQLLAHSSPVIEDGTVGADSVEALGWLIAELGDMTSFCLVLASECRRRH